MSPYEILVDVLDKLRSEAPSTFRSYYPDPNDEEELNAARAKALLHLFLKVRFGLLTFAEREPYITEGTHDGGIDAYYIDSERRVIHFLQAKFRTNEKNFEDKSIDPKELLMMDITRVLEGETRYETGAEYNQKVLKMAQRIREIKDIGRYNYVVVILANASGITKQKLSILTGGLPAELIDYKACYSKLLFPLISGTYYHADELQLSLSLSNKSAGAKISYTVVTEFTKCEITVIFVPTLEVAKAMFKYRNSILQYNPRSYLGHEGRAVNREIRRSIENRQTNEFSLFNNGITILSDETYLNERIGQKDRAQLVLNNPQIINGGQTAYTLSTIYQENLHNNVSELFGEKEVLVKVITFEGGSDLPEEKKLELIEDISRATNQQTAVTIADRRSNETSVKELQKRIFDSTGMFLERKLGEFEDGLRQGYIRPSEIIERTLFFRSAFLAKGELNNALQRKLASNTDYAQLTNVSEEMLERYAFAVLLLTKMTYRKHGNMAAITSLMLVKIYFGLTLAFEPGLTSSQREQSVGLVASWLTQRWRRFLRFLALSNRTINLGARKRRISASFEKYINSATFLEDISEFLTWESQSGRSFETIPGESTEKANRNIEKLELKLEHLYTFRSKRQSNLAKLRDKLPASESDEFRETIKEWIEDEEDRIKSVEYRIRQVEGWLDGEVRKPRATETSVSGSDPHSGTE